MNHSNNGQRQTQHSKLSTSYGIAISGTVFYFAHVLQQAQARDTALMNKTLPSDTELTQSLTDDSTPIQVVSLDQLEPVNIETISSHTVTTSLVSVDDDDYYQATGVEGKDAIDMPSEGPSPLLLIGGAALIGGGIAVLTDDDDNDSPEETIDDPGPSINVVEIPGNSLNFPGNNLNGILVASDSFDNFMPETVISGVSEEKEENDSYVYAYHKLQNENPVLLSPISAVPDDDLEFALENGSELSLNEGLL